MAAWWPAVVTLPFIALLLSSGLWANRRFGRFDRIPAHFDIAGKPTRMAPRRTMVWLLPGLFSASLVLIALMTAFIPREHQNGDPAMGALVGGVALLGAQAFVLWLTERWARSQPGRQ